MFNNEYGVYEKRNIWNFNYVSMCNSVEWHAMYSKGRTEVMGCIVPRVTSPGVGMVACERGWGVTKRIKYGQSDNLTGVSTEKLSIISTAHKLNKAIINHEALEEI